MAGAKIYKMGVAVEGDPKGGMRALQVTGKEAEKLNRKFKRGKRDIQSYAREMRKMQGILAGLTTGLVLYRGVDMVNAYKSQEQAVASLDAALESMDRTTAGLSEQLRTLASDIQSDGIIGDEAIIKGQSFLATYREISDDLLPRATQAMVDLAAKMGGNTTNAANMVGKAAMGMSAELRRAGITIDEDIAKSGDFAAILSELEKQVGGTNAALAATKTGGFDQFGNALGDLREDMGKILAIGLSDYFRELSGEMRLSEETIQDLGEDVRWLASHIDEAAIAVGGLLAARMLGPMLSTAAVGAIALGRGLSTANIGAAALAGTAGVLRGVLGFLGGPAGLIITAATAAAVWSSNSSDAADDTDKWKKSVDGLNGSLGNLEIANLERQIAKAKTNIQDLAKEAFKRSPMETLLGVDWNSDRELFKREQYSAAVDQLGQLEAQHRKLVAAEQARQASAGKLNGTIKGLSKSTKELAKDEQALLDALFPEDEAFRNYTDQLNMLEKMRAKLGDNKYQEALDRLTEQYLDLGDAVEGSATAMQYMEENFSGTMNAMSDSLAEFITTGELDLQSFVSMAVRELSQLAMSNYKSTGSIFGSAGGGGDVITSIGTFFSDLFHTGRGPGEAATMGRYVHPAVFADAPRYHTGIGPGEQAAIIRRDESVLTPAQMRALAPVSERRSGDINIDVHIHGVPGGVRESSRRQQRQANGDIRLDLYLDQIEQSMAERTMRDGGPLNSAVVDVASGGSNYR